MYSISTGRWSQQSVEGVAPAVRSGAAYAYVNDQILVYGGVDGVATAEGITTGAFRGELHVLDLQMLQWEQLDSDVCHEQFGKWFGSTLTYVHGMVLAIGGVSWHMERAEPIDWDYSWTDWWIEQLTDKEPIHDGSSAQNPTVFTETFDETFETDQTNSGTIPSNLALHTVTVVLSSELQSELREA